MAKIIKKIGRVILITASTLLVAIVVLFLMLQTSRSQTFLVRQLTERISDRSGIAISIGKVSYSLFRKIMLDNVLVKDQNGDTLLAVRHAGLRIKEFNPSEKTYRFGRVDLTEPDFRMVTDTAGMMNLTWLIDKIRGDRQPDTVSSVQISFSTINAYGGSYRLINMNDTSGIEPGKVNFMHMILTGISTRIRDLIINRDSVSMSIRNLAFTEAGGFTSQSANMDLTVSDSDIYLREIDLLTDSSSVIADRIYLMPADQNSWKDFINKVRFDMRFQTSVLNMSDLAYFTGNMAGIRETVNLSGILSGTVSEMKGRDVMISYSDRTRLRFSFDISGLPAVNDSYLFVNFTDMQTNAEDIERFFFSAVKQVRLPSVVHDLGMITYKGNFTGFITDFVTFGRLTTERGSLSTDLSLRPEGRNLASFKGFLRASNVDLAYITRNPDLFGPLWLHADIDGSIRSFKYITANINGVIDSVGINDYLYRNVSVEGKYAERIWDGTVSVNDQNIRMDVMGRFDLAGSMPEFDFTMNLAQADLHRLNLYRNDTVFMASALLTASFRGSRLSDMIGNMRMINSAVQNSNGRINIYDMMVSSANVNGVPSLTLRSDFADAEVRGYYTAEAISTSLRTILSEILPSKFPVPEEKKAGDTSSVSFTFDARIKKIDKLNEFFGTGLSISEGSHLTGRFLSDHSEIDADFISDAVGYAGFRFGNLSLKNRVRGGTMEIYLSCDTLLLPDGSELDNFYVTAQSSSDTTDLSLKWNNHDNGRTFGEAQARGYYSLNEKGRPFLTIGILPTTFTVNRRPWAITPARIVIDSTSIAFDNILISSKANYIRLDGKVSADPDDRLTLSFEGMNLAYLNNIMNENKPEKQKSSVEMRFGGMMDGAITFSDVYDNILFESNINISDFMLNENRYGFVNVVSEWDPRQKVAVIKASNDYQGFKYFDISGTYIPSSREADVNVYVFRMPLDILNPLVSAFASDVRGTGSGKVRIIGKMKQLALSGAVKAEDASMKISFLQTRYSFSDSIRFNRKGIEFRNIRIFDEKRNQGILNGAITHNSFKDFGYSFDIDMNKMLVMNTRAKDNEDFYGTAYATGHAGIRGTESAIDFNISARTEGNTVFYVPLNTSSSVRDYPFIVFIDPERKDEKSGSDGENIFIRREQSSNMSLNFDLEITPEAEVQLIMDETAGDVIRGTGSGRLNISLNPRGEMRMAGDYVIESGDYLFTLGNILNKRFSVEQGGRISWNGAIDDAELDLKAIYRTRASLYDINPDPLQAHLKEKIPVECHLILSGKLLNPVVKFDISLPTADEGSREYLRMAINTEEQLSRQFLYLLVMNSFYADPQSPYAAGSTIGSGDIPSGEIIGTTASVTTVEMLSNQLSNWLSKISNDFDIGFKYRPSNFTAVQDDSRRDQTQQEVELALSTQLLNDRVIINGNVDMRGSQTSNTSRNVTGEFTVEFKITERLRFKVFNRLNNDLFYETPPNTQGVGVFYKRDFNRLKDLFILPDNRNRKNTSVKDASGGQ